MATLSFSRPFYFSQAENQFIGSTRRMQSEFYRIGFRKKLYGTIADLQADLYQWLEEFNQSRPHQGRWCFGKTPMQTLLDAKPITEESLQSDNHGDNRDRVNER